MALLIGAAFGIAPAPASAPTNVLVIVADDLAFRATGYGGSRLALTPNLDRLAQRSVGFLRAYCNAPVCSASRQSFLTGRLPQEIGVTLLSTPLPDEVVTLADVYQAAGYRAAALGKMHFNNQSAHGFATRVDRPEYDRFRKSRPPRALPPGIEVLPAWRPFVDPAAVWLNARVLPYPAVDADMFGTYLVEEAKGVLGANSAKPFFLLVSFTEPHSPFHFPIDARRRVDPRALTVPPVGPEDDDQIPAIFRGLSDEEKRGIQAAYLTSVAYLDRNVGRLLEALEASGAADSTLVVFLSDHGYLLGEHGRFEKHCFYEEAIRTPLLISFPRRFPARESRALVELVDLAPTLLELSGLTAPTSGVSLVGLLAGGPDVHRADVFSLYTENEEAMIGDGRWKYVYSTGRRRRTDGYDPGRPLPRPWIRLYDMERDPGERTNVAGEAALRPVVERLANRLYDRLVPSHFRRAEMPLGLSRGAATDWCLVPRDSRSARSEESTSRGPHAK